ncbi:hypothetical protein [Komagataeibacter saccharivorans]|uniref:hypothetical protein n=1 Tax=Komagataeibacter saccharivorans TaxID=265959 RepID=UPI0024A9AB56|nr:hypothetical protein [Komagataeibacter saccharivorans]
MEIPRSHFDLIAINLIRPHPNPILTTRPIPDIRQQRRSIDNLQGDQMDRFPSF